MKLKNPCFGLFLLCFFLLAAVVSTAQNSNQANYLRRIQNGSQLYDLSRWYEAAMEFRRAQEIAVNINDWSQALYWVILSELAYSDYGSALRDMDELQRNAPGSGFSRDMLYHRARVYFNQGFFDEALLLFRHFTDSVSDVNRETSDRRAAAFFWMGECLYAMGQFDEAENFYSFVITRYPESLKVDAASYRIDLIRQKKIEAELLALLQWSHEETLRTSEDYQRKIRTYEYTLNTYQRRIAELTQGQEPAGLNSEIQEVRPAQAPVTPSSPQSPPSLSSLPLSLFSDSDPAPSQSPAAVDNPPARPPANMPKGNNPALNIPAQNTPLNNPTQNNSRQQQADESLLEWARRLGIDLQQLMDEINNSGGSM
jgi:tetratricopeptide (TPR) repeat protein